MKRFLLLLLVLLALLAGCVPPDRIRLIGEESEPEATERPELTATATSRPTLPPTPTPTRNAYQEFFQRPDGDSFRVMSYNVNWDSIFPDDDPQNHDLRSFERVEAFGRVLRAVQPDIICLQEINYIRPSEQIGTLVAEALGESEPWYVVKERDSFLVSRYPLERDGYQLITTGVINILKQAAALVDLPDDQYERDLYVICAHFKAGGSTSDVLLRQEQADVIMSQVQDAMTPGGNLNLPSGTPYILMGDFNIYDTDPHNHLWTMLRGDIYEERRYGNDFAPDWDGTNLADVAPSHNGLGADTYTWRDDTSPFNPGAYDRMLFTDSVLEAPNAFVLNTALLPPDVLLQRGLEEGDVALSLPEGNYDHLPVVIDFLLIVSR